MADPPPPAAGEGLLPPPSTHPPPFLPAAPPPIPVVDAPPLVLEDEKLCKERRLEGMLSQEHKVGGVIHGPRSNMGTCKESPRFKKRKLQVEEGEIHRDKYNPEIVRNDSPRSKKFKSNKNKGAAAVPPPVDTILHKEKVRPEINGDINVRKEITGSRRKFRRVIWTFPKVRLIKGEEINHVIIFFCCSNPICSDWQYTVGSIHVVIYYYLLHLSIRWHRFSRELDVSAW